MHQLPGPLAEPLLALAALIVLIGSALLVLAVVIGPQRKPAARPAKTKPVLPAAPEPPTYDPVFTQVGFIELDGRLVPLRTLVRQSPVLDEHRLREINRTLPPPDR